MDSQDCKLTYGETVSLPAVWKLHEKSGNLKMKTSKHKELSAVLVVFWVLGGFFCGFLVF